MTLRAGSLLGRYRLVERAGVGGMSEVWKAEDTTLHRTVAVKVILTPIADDASYRERFLREARLVASLEHPNVLPVYDFGTEMIEGVELSFLVMPLVPGGSLKGQISGPMPFETAAEWLKAVADALDHAHAKGILHRDVKPGNVLLDAQGRPLLADFGLARSYGSTSGLTQAGIALGTPLYMAPEQALGLPLDGRADQYALAIIGYELLTGVAPFRADTPALLMGQHASVPPPPASSVVRDIPVAADAVLSRALAKNAAERYPSCTEFVEALAAALGVPLAKATSSRIGPRAPRTIATATPAPIPPDESSWEVETAATRKREIPSAKPAGLRLVLVPAAGLLALAGVALVVLRLVPTSTSGTAPSPATTAPTATTTPLPAAPASAPPPGAPVSSPAAPEPEKPPAPARPPRARAPARATAGPSEEEARRALEAAREAEAARAREAEAAAAAARQAATPSVKEGDLLDISQVDTPPAAATMVKPEMTAMARTLKVGGTVRLRVLVSEAGRSAAVEIVSDTRPSVGLAESARDAVLKWTWRPAMKDGKKVRTWTAVSIPFVFR